MASYKNFYGPKTLSAKQLGNKKIKGKILDVTPVTMRGADKIVHTRLCLTVQGETKRIPLNATNAETLGTKYGEDFAKWKGKTVTIQVHKTQFEDQDVDGLLVTPN
jgi:hypothetical protein